MTGFEDRRCHPRIRTGTFLLDYAKAYFENGYHREARQRGVLVIRVEKHEKMPGHYWFRLFSKDTYPPVIIAAFRGQLMKVKRAMGELFYSDAGIGLTKELHYRPVLRSGDLGDSLASVVLKLTERPRPESPSRNEVATLLRRVHTMMLRHQSLLELKWLCLK